MEILFINRPGDRATMHHGRFNEHDMGDRTSLHKDEGESRIWILDLKSASERLSESLYFLNFNGQTDGLCEFCTPEEIIQRELYIDGTVSSSELYTCSVFGSLKQTWPI
jgi:hypothetical protein